MLNLLFIYFTVTILALLISITVILLFKIKRPIRLTAIVMAVLIVPAICIYFVSTQIMVLSEAKVPNLAGLTAEQAQQIAKEHNLSITVTQKIFEQDIPADIIISQRPEAGRTVKIGRVINLIVSIGKSKVLVPNLVGKDFSQINVVLKASGLMLGDARKIYSVEFPTNTVIAQSPPAGDEVMTGSVVSVNICVNPNEAATKEAAPEDNNEN